MKKLLKNLGVGAIAVLPLAVLTLCVGLCAGCEGDWWESNRCELLDRNHTFTKVTILYGEKDMTYDVIAWKDYENSDTVQVWVRDETCPDKMRVILTHYSRMILENPAPKYKPKF